MKILITGINGFIGRNLQTYFMQPGFELIGVEKSDNFLNSNIKQYAWEELYKISEADCIIHLAGLAHDTNNKKLEDEYYQVNTELTKTIFRFFLTSSARIFICFSTVKAAADFSETPLVETVIPEPTTIYGKSKFKAEEYILNNLPNDARKVYILRPCMIHGPKPKENLVSLYNYIRKGLPYPFGKLSNNRSYLSIKNLNFILEKLLENTEPETCNLKPETCNLKPITPSGIYHLADDEPLSTNRIIELIGETLHKKPLMISLPAWSIKALAQMGSMLHLPINTETIRKLTGNFLVSNEKIKKALKITSLPVSAEEGMRYTLKNII